jgi:alkylation response protein AidB-like acyl-CoA dehydrogenase
MDFGLSEDQIMLDETLRSFLADQVSIERIRSLREESCPNHRDIWKELAELGATGILVPEEHGGSELSLLDAAVVAWTLGHAVTPSPFLGSSILATVALRDLSHDAIPGWLGGIASGETIFGVAATELFSKREEAGIRIEGGTLHGKAMMALDACNADFILVGVDPETLAVFRRDAEGVEVNRLRTTDATRCTSEILLKGATTEAVFENVGPTVQRMLEAGRIALAAETLGACEAMIEQAVAYAKERKQFNRVIGSFQAVKHMCSEMIADLEPARSLLWYAAHSFNAMPDETPLMSCHVLAHASEIGRDIASVATQVHGGIGWTDDQNLHFWFKRIGVARHLLGGPEFLRNRAAELQGLAKAS